MEENDTPTTVQVEQFQETEGGSCEIYLEDDDEDVHVCRKCNKVFYDIQKYLEHKIKHDNYRVKYCRSDLDRRMIMPKLIQKVTVKKEPKTDTESGPNDDEKENNKRKAKVRKQRKRLNDFHNQDLVITDKPVYFCTKCDKKFKREATLRRHTEYDHNEDDEGDSDDEWDDDRDRDYKPNLDIKEEFVEDSASQEPPEMDSLDRVIMAAQLMEQAEGGDRSVEGDRSMQGTVFSVPVVVSAQQLEKRQKLTEEERASRKFGCPVCGNKFKEINVLKTHMLTHTEKREYVCTYQDCTYSFKTKGSLKRHVRRHTGERPYPCELCGRTFAESGALTRHLKSRTPCTRKTDNDLPRYGKKWSYTPNIPAATARTVGDRSRSESAEEHPSLASEIRKITMMEPVPEISVSLGPEVAGAGEQLSAMTTVVQVLTDALSTDQQKEFFELEHPEGVEIVISGTGEVEDELSDEGIGQFVQTETEIRDGHSSVCKVCYEDFLCVEALKIHLRTHLADNTCRCWLCHFHSESKEQFENHMLMHHHVQLKGNDPFKHFSPLEEENKEKNARKNKQEMHRDAQIAVKQLLELPEDVLEDMDVQTEVANRTLYKCPVCMKHFRGNHYLKLHMRNHTGLRPHKCDECDKSFITKDTLNKHMTSHIDERNFKCGECGKLFKRLSHVREHIKIHSGTRPFVCTVCDKSFKTNNAMKVHLRTHTEILPYECRFCHRRFREKGSVQRHMRMHTGEKPHTCTYCGRSFAEHGTLNRHLKAKVSCTKQLQEIRDSDTDYTVLAEFSSVVADTQQYIIPSEESTTDGEHELHSSQPEQAAEFVVVQTTEEENQSQNVEIITEDAEHTSLIEGVQVTDDYVVITEADGSGMKILDSKSGEIVAIVPISSVEEEQNQVQSITLSEEGNIAAITMTSGMELQAQKYDEESVPNIASLLAGGNVLEQVVGSEESAVAGMEQTMDVDDHRTEQAGVIESLVMVQNDTEQGEIGETSEMEQEPS